MSFLNLLPIFSRLSVHTVSGIRNISACTNPLYFKVSNALLGEPLKKKKKLDPAIIRAREERKKKKLEKQIRKLEKATKQLKPVSELEIPLKLIDEKKKRLRQLPKLSEEEVESRILLQKEWSRYKTQQHLNNVQIIDSIFYSQQKALDELRAESEQLYQEAIHLKVH
ncbi:39S ribosomal protein L40, mitochondrial isoform X2 [Camponotus floridanus]|uniref:39S ribosomal protein L40, mitochondrial isoform X2 n=1 Tax=Camponotus floridanus TaxID=104421 RepID=UPI00059C887B|nr:39S ribosomal protein L40, mitochondrial isoform X2 [Camponotus floridanus]